MSTLSRAQKLVHSPGERDSRRCVAWFFVALTVIGLIMGIWYTASCDEDAEYKILKSTMGEYALRLLGEDSRIYRAVCDDIAPISEYIDRDHGISAYYIMSPVFMFLRKISRYIMTQAWHGWTFLLFMAGVYALYAITREVFSAPRALSCAAALFLYLSPRIFAEGHYNNKDVVLLSLVLMTIYLGTRLIRLNRPRDAVLFSVVGAFAANTKIIGAWFWGVFGLTYLIIRIARHEMTKRTWRNGICAILTFFAAYIILTPAAWTDFFGFIRYLIDNAVHFSRWMMYLLFDGELIYPLAGEAPPWNYLPRIMLMTTPVLIILLMIAGFACFARNIARVKKLDAGARDELWILVAVIIGCAVPLFVAMCSESVLYNGWRHFYFVYAGVLLVAVYALTRAYRALRARKRLLRVGAALIAAYFCLQGALLVYNHPLQASYYNFICAPIVEGRYETDYWLLSAGDAVKRLENCDERDQSLEPIYTVTMLACPMVERLSLALPPTDTRFTRDLNEANYFVSISMYETIDSLLPEDDYAAFSSQYLDYFTEAGLPARERDWNKEGEFELLFTLTSYGTEVAAVYQRVSPANDN